MYRSLLKYYETSKSNNIAMRTKTKENTAAKEYFLLYYIRFCDVFFSALCDVQHNDRGCRGRKTTHILCKASLKLFKPINIWLLGAVDKRTFWKFSRERERFKGVKKEEMRKLHEIKRNGSKGKWIYAKERKFIY